MPTHAPDPIRRLTRSVRRPLRALAGDRQALLAFSLAAAMTVAGLIDGGDATRDVLIASVAIVAGQLLVGSLRARRLRSARRSIELLQLVLTVAYVAVGIALIGDATFRPGALYLPILAFAAAMGPRELAVVSIFTAYFYLSPVLANPALAASTLQRGFALAVAGAVIALGTRRTVAALDAAVQRLRGSVLIERRRRAQLAGVEAVGRLLAREGPTPEALAQTVDVLADRFDYPLVSIYLGGERSMHLGAQFGYRAPIETFDAGLGILGRVMRERRPVLVADVAREPGYIPGTDQADQAGSLICMPLLADDQLLGVLNVETRTPGGLDDADLQGVALVADRLATSLALAARRAELAEQAELFRRLAAFSTAANRADRPDVLHAVIASAARDVVPSASVLLAVGQGPGAAGSSDLVIRAVAGGAGGDQLGAPADGTLVAEVLESGAAAFVDGPLTEVVAPFIPGPARASLAGTAVLPLHDGNRLVGVLIVARLLPAPPFTDAEREVLTVLARHAALGLANADLRAGLERSALHDPLTGLSNRRHLDDSVARLTAVRQRTPAEDRRPVTAIVFDVDHFRAFNRRYGHATGDAVLRAFGDVLRERVRASDFAARYGGEEFVVLLDGSDEAGAVVVAEDVRERLAALDLRSPDGEPMALRVSAGVAELPADRSDVDEAIRMGDAALGRAKARGRDRVVRSSAIRGAAAAQAPMPAGESAGAAAEAASLSA